MYNVLEELYVESVEEWSYYGFLFLVIDEFIYSIVEEFYIYDI